MNLNCREHGEAATICHLNYWIIWAFSLHPSIIWKQNCCQFIFNLAECPGAGHLIGVFSRDNGEVRVNKLQQRQIKNIWLINSSVQCGGGARHGSPACPHTAPQVPTLAPAQDLDQDIKLGRICPNLSFVPPNHGHHPPSTGEKRNVVKFFAVKINVSAWQYICQLRHNFGSNWRKVPKLNGNFFNFPLG